MPGDRHGCPLHNTLPRLPHLRQRWGEACQGPVGLHPMHSRTCLRGLSLAAAPAQDALVGPMVSQLTLLSHHVPRIAPRCTAAAAAPSPASARRAAACPAGLRQPRRAGRSPAARASLPGCARRGGDWQSQQAPALGGRCRGRNGASSAQTSTGCLGSAALRCNGASSAQTLTSAPPGSSGCSISRVRKPGTGSLVSPPTFLANFFRLHAGPMWVGAGIADNQHARGCGRRQRQAQLSRRQRCVQARVPAG